MASAESLSFDIAPFTRDASVVLVTGATGFIASHCVRVSLEAGLTVRGTVRSLANEAKLRHLRELPGAAERLELVEANLLDASCWAAVVKGCSHVLHVASPAPAKLPKNEDELVKPAVEGTTNVLKAAHAAGVRRVVVTSSNASVAHGHDDLVAKGHAYGGVLLLPLSCVHSSPLVQVHRRGLVDSRESNRNGGVRVHGFSQQFFLVMLSILTPPV